MGETGSGASLSPHPGLTSPNGRGAGPSPSPETPTPPPKWFAMSGNAFAHFSFNDFIFIEQIFAFEEWRVSAFFFFFPCLSFPAFLLLKRREPICFRDVCAYRLYHLCVTCFEEKCFRLWVCLAVNICSYFCEFNTMYHCIIVTFIKQIIN